MESCSLFIFWINNSFTYIFYIVDIQEEFKKLRGVLNKFDLDYHFRLLKKKEILPLKVEIFKRNLVPYFYFLNK